MNDRRTERFSRNRGKLALWYGVLAGPVGWSVHLLVSYSLVRYVCRTGATWPLHLTTVAALAIAASGGSVAWRAWRDLGDGWRTAGGDVLARSRFMAVSGLVLSVGNLLLILVEAVPNFVLEASCY